MIKGSKELRAIPGVRNFGSHIGQALLGEEIAGVDFGENWISIDPKADYDKTRAKIEEVVVRLPRHVHQRRDLPRGADQRGDHRGERADRRAHRRPEPRGPAREGATRSRRCSATIKGVVDEHVELQVDVPQIEVDVDLAKAQAYGIKPGDVRRAAATIMSGEEVGDIFRDGKTYDVQVWSTPAVPQQRRRHPRTPRRHADWWARAGSATSRR